MAGNIRNHTDLIVYQRAFEAAMQVFALTKSLPKEENYSLKDQIRRSTRSVCANLAEAWRKRRYQAHFISKLSDAETEAAESQVWIQFASACGYWTNAESEPLTEAYNRILGTIVGMINHPETWVIREFPA